MLVIDEHSCSRHCFRYNEHSPLLSCSHILQVHCVRPKIYVHCQNCWIGERKLVAKNFHDTIENLFAELSVAKFVGPRVLTTCPLI